VRLVVVDTWWARIYLSGPMDVAKQVIRKDCLREGLCVTIEPSAFIYTGGEETGYVVGLIHYPRFPTEREQITSRARNLAELLLNETHQRSALVMTPERTEWITREEAA
jgi:hypothetical protein